MIHERLKKQKIIILILIFACAMSIAFVAGVFSSFITSTSSGFSINFEPVGEVTLHNGEIMNSMFAMSGGEPESVKSITFDYYTEETRSKIEGYTYSRDVSLDESGKIMLYSKPVGTSNVDVYVLSYGEILANENCYNMFSSLDECESIIFNNFSTKNVTNMRAMFYGCTSLKSLDLSNFNTENVVYLDMMFYSCSSLTSLDLTSFNTDKAQNSFKSMFYNCSSLVELDISTFNTYQTTSMSWMFCNCSSLTTIYVGHLWHTENLTYDTCMFQGCINLVGRYGTTWNSLYVGSTYANIDTLDNSGYLTGRVQLTNDGSFLNMLIRDDDDYYVEDYKIYNVTFDYDSSTYVNIKNLAKKEIVLQTDYGGNPLVTIYQETLSGSLRNIYILSSCDIYAPTDSSYLFFGLTACMNFIFDNFYTNRVTNMSYMFSRCSNIVNLDLLTFNTNKVVDMSGLFNSCSSLADLKITSFDTSNVTSMASMFADFRFDSTIIEGPRFVELDLSNFDTRNVVTMDTMFRGCNKLKTIYTGNLWDSNKVTSSMDMFLDCINLVGGAGTVYNSSYTDATYARIDEGTGAPGYFTGCVTLVDGKELNKLIKNVSDYVESDSTVQKVVFDKYLDEYNVIIQGITPISVASDGSFLVQMYRVPNGNNYDVYILSNSDIYAPVDSSYMFQRLHGLKNIQFNNLNTSGVTSMECMFAKCLELTSLDLSGLIHLM